ncbi:MAG TPA: DHA2 family efflux MFS transporter permease subunit [Candidatus Elarobacter sp.]|nr:DHA2 family efflux MFS transporter permease subunit [Candidatus Elarobacter sp.]
MRPARSSLLLVVVTVMIGVLMGVLDAAIVNVAIPTISGNLGATADLTAWVATGYTLGMMIVMPLNGWLTARLGQKRYYLAAFGLFTVMSLLCGAAPTIVTLIVFRVIQGFGGGALQPIALSILLGSAPAERRSDMVAAFSFASVAPFALGPVIGGYLLDNSDWRMLFYFKLPICVLGLVMAWFVLSDDRVKGAAGKLHWPSLAALAITLAALQYVLSTGQRADWFESGTITAFTVIAVVAAVSFVWMQLRMARPLVNLGIFRIVSFSAGCLITVVSGFGLYGINLVTPLFFQGPLKLSPYDTGIYLLQGSIATALLIPFVGPLTRRIDARIIIGIGLVTFVVGAWIMGDLSADAGYADIFWPRVLQGLALGALFVPLVAVTLAQIPPAALSDATGMATLVRYLGGNIGIAVLQVLQVRRSVAAADAMAATATLGHPIVAGAVGALGIERARAMLTGVIAANANTVSYLYLFRVSAILFACTIPLLFFLPNLRAARHAPPSAGAVEELVVELEEPAAQGRLPAGVATS